MDASGTNILKAGQRDKSPESGIVPPKAGRLECMRFPADEERINIWLKKIPRDFIINKESVLCALHFTDADFIIDKKDQGKSRVVEGTKLKHKRLRKDTIPSIWPNCPHYLSSPVTLRPTSSTTTEARQKKTGFYN